MKILLSGGHLTPALALIEYLQKTEPTVEIVFVGRRYSQDSEKQRAWEYPEVTKRGVPFLSLQAVRFGRLNRWYQYLPACWLFPSSVLQASWIMLRHRPTVFVSFGGYLAVPLAIAAWICRVPIVTHEQTRISGRANQFIGWLARKIAVSFPETAEYYPPQKVVVTGNPLRETLLAAKPTRPDWWPTTVKKPVLYVTGGNQGSSVINALIGQLVPTLTKRWLVVHQCGAKHKNANYQRELEKIRASLSPTLQQAYVVKEWVSEDDLAWLYHQATVVVSRAGANTVTELAASRVPSILIPLPFAYLDEQQHNAEWLETQGGAVVISQKNLNSETLLAALTKVANHRSAMKAQLAQIEIEVRGAEKLWHVIRTLK